MFKCEVLLSKCNRLPVECEFNVCVYAVPDAIVLKLLMKRLSQLDCVSRGWVLQGYPRTCSQAQSLADAGITANRSQ